MQKEQECDNVEYLKNQLNKWRNLLKYLPPTNNDRDEFGEIEKLIKKAIK